MRLGEVVGLRRDAVDLDNATITLLRTKTNKVRRVPIIASLAQFLRDAMATQDGPHVFINEYGNPQTYSASKHFREAVKKAGIANLRFHDLRHDFATKLRRRGVGLDVIAELLGHSSLAMTRRYAHIGGEELRAAVALLDKPNSTASAVAASTKNGSPLVTAR
jgi:integrase